MPTRRCRAPGCGRFVAARADVCSRHRDAEDGDVLHVEIHALRHVLSRLLREVDDLDTLVKHIPRVSTVAIQAAKARHQIGERGQGDLTAFLFPILEELDRLQEEHELLG